MQEMDDTGSIVRATARPEPDPGDPREWSWVEASVWTDRMLAALGNGVRGGKWHSLIDKVYASQTLWAAWRRVAANHGAAGIDRMSVERFEANAEYYLKVLGQGVAEPQLQTRSDQARLHSQRQGKDPAAGYCDGQRPDCTGDFEVGVRTDI